MCLTITFKEQFQVITLEKTSEGVTFFFLVFTRCLGENWTSGPRKMISGEATHCLVSALDGKRIQFGIGILTKRICYYPLLLVNRHFLTNDYYSPISTMNLLCFCLVSPKQKKSCVDLLLSCLNCFVLRQKNNT